MFKHHCLISRRGRKRILESLPKSEVFSKAGTAKGDTPAVMSEVDKQYAKAFGLSEEDYKKYSKEER